MSAIRLLRVARHRSGLSQRQLAERTGVAQPTIARIESGAVSPRLQTLERLLNECGYRLSMSEEISGGVDRTAIRELLRLNPAERLRLAVQEAAVLARLS